MTQDTQVQVVVDGIVFKGTVKEVLLREGPEEYFYNEAGELVLGRKQAVKYRVEVPTRGDSFIFYGSEINANP